MGNQLQQLSKREKEVMAQLATGDTVKEIASKLFISPYTVDSHIKNIKKKLRARSLSHMTMKFVLSLDNPKKFLRSTTVIAMIGIQSFVAFAIPDIDIKRPRQCRLAKHRKFKNRRTYYYL